MTRRAWLTKRERGIWRAAITLAHNICVQQGNAINRDDGGSEAIDAATGCAQRIAGWIEPDDAQLAEMFAEAGVPDDCDFMGEALNSGDGVYRP